MRRPQLDPLPAEPCTLARSKPFQRGPELGPEVVRDQPGGDIHGGVVDGLGGAEQAGLAVIEIHQVDEHAALVGGAQQAFQPRQPIRLERTIRRKGAHIGAPARAEAIGVLTIDAVDGLIVPGWRALQAHVDHEHAMILVKIQRLDHGIRVEFGIEGALVHPLVEKQGVGQADVHELALGFAAVGGAAVGLLPAFAGCRGRARADIKGALIVALAQHESGTDLSGAQDRREQRQDEEPIHDDIISLGGAGLA